FRLAFKPVAGRPMKWALKRFCFLLRLWAKGRQAICDCAQKKEPTKKNQRCLKDRTSENCYFCHLFRIKLLIDRIFYVM
ncbi:MAG: hypothetical protein LBN74_08700, partial [Prevotella sp.]|nr:hypothetical protein [Prevotella sp.]